MADRKLGDAVPLGRQTLQSTGELYDAFMARKDRGIHKWHHYFDVYERYLSRLRGSKIRLLEIGVRQGGSLLLWADYLGPLATIVGIDIVPAVRKLDGCRPNVAVRIGNQADTGFLAEIDREFGPFDVVIDDGGHTARQQINSFNFLYPRMAERGVYLCEDTHTSYWAKFADAGPGVTMIEHAKKMVDHLHELYARTDDSDRRFGTPPEMRDGPMLVSRFAAETFSIQFYDSIIAFERRPRMEPFREVR